MLVRLQPDDIEKGWEIISEALKGSVPEHLRVDEHAITHMLYGLLDGTLQCWVVGEDDWKENGIHAIVTTTISTDTVSKTRNLLIYSLYGIRPLNDAMVKDSFETLKTYAKANGCFKIVAYTDVEVVKNMVIGLGGNVGHTLLEMRI